MDQFIKQFRQEKKLSQRDLAKLTGTSQQQIQRLEAGISPIRLDLAVRICNALDLPMEKVFPTLSPVLKKFPGRKLASEKALEELSGAGIEIEGVIWTAEFGLRNGVAKQFTLPSAEKRRLEEFLRNWEYHFGDQTGIPFFWFDSDRYSICVNLSQLVYSRFMFDGPGLEASEAMSYEEVCDRAPHIEVWMNGQREPLEFSAEPDEISDLEEEEEEQPESGQLEELLILLDSNMADDGFVSFMDNDGEDVYLRVADITMIAVPQWLLKPELLDGLEESEQEESSPQKPSGPSLVQ